MKYTANMKQKTIDIYEYSELSPEAKEKALQHFRENNFDTYGLQVHLDNEIEALLEKYAIEPIEDVKGYPSKYAKIYFSLAHCQGDGVMFEGVFAWKKYRVNIKHSGHYYHSYSKHIEIQERKRPWFDIDNDEVYVEFEKIYQIICSELVEEGYRHIDDMESEECFIEVCNANEWTFRSDGTTENI